MSISSHLQATARAAYRDLLRAAAATFRGDDVVRNAFRTKMRSEVIPSAAAVTDSATFEQKVTLAREIAEVLRKNIVQAHRVENAQEDIWKLQFTEHTELGSNDTIKHPPPMTQSSRSARKRSTTSPGVASASSDNNTTSFTSQSPLFSSQSQSHGGSGGERAVPRYYSQLKKAHKERQMPELREEDIEEQFVRGSGPGGQSINKTENNVQLLHKPTRIRVNCQETRSLAQNRKIARKILLERLDQLYNPGLSKQNLQKAKQLERERRRRKKAKKKAEARAAEQGASDDKLEED